MYTGHVCTTSNRADWIEDFTLLDVDSGDLIDISLCRITLTLSKAPRQPNVQQSPLYGDFYYGYGGGPILTGSTDSGEITLVDVGTFEVNFPALRMAGVPGGYYQLGVRIMQDTRTVQLIVGTVDVTEGIDTQ
jgi:hypothetical protein